MDYSHKEAPDKSIQLNKIKVQGAPLALSSSRAQTIGLHPTEPNASVINLQILKQGNIRVFKEDAETGVKAQGAAFRKCGLWFCISRWKRLKKLP